MEKKDIFDRFMALPGLRIFEPFYRKYKEVLMYLLFGGLTTVVSVAAFALFYRLMGIHELVANVLSWILAVLFAYVTNRTWVFASRADTPAGIAREILTFFGGRLATLLVEEGILAVFISWLALPAVPVKLAAQVVVIVLNYVISKLFVFRNPAPSAEETEPAEVTEKTEAADETEETEETEPADETPGGP